MEYNAGSDFFYQIANVTFGDLATTLKHRKQIRGAMKVINQRGDTDEETFEKEDNRPRKVPIRKTNNQRKLTNL